MKHRKAHEWQYLKFLVRAITQSLTKALSYMTRDGNDLAYMWRKSLNGKAVLMKLFSTTTLWNIVFDWVEEQFYIGGMYITKVKSSTFFLLDFGV